MATRIAGLGVVFLALVSCTLTGRTAITPAEVRATLSARLHETRLAQTAALDLWDRLIVGEAVSCDEAIPVPELLNLSGEARQTHTNAVPIEQHLNEAIQAVRNASDLWHIECSTERSLVPLEIARAGREEALSATAPLDAAEALLMGWSPE